MKQLARHYALIVTFAAVVLFTNLGGPRLWDRDEPRNAGCTAEMLAAGDWVVPVFNAELRGDKPILIYWLMMAAYGVFGVNEFGARFWSAALGVGTALTTYHVGRRLFNPSVGLWGGLILSTTIMFDVAGRAATPDSPLIFFSTAALMVYVLGTFKPKPLDAAHDAPCELRHTGHYFPKHRAVIALLYAMMGIAVLAKGPVGLVLPTAVIGMFLLIVRLPAVAAPANRGADRNVRLSVRLLRAVPGMLRPFGPRHFLATCWHMRPLTALAVVAAVALPWYVWVGIRTDGRWLEVFFWEHNIERAAGVKEGHDGSLLYYPMAVLVGFFPWSVFAAPLLIDLTARLRRREAWHPGYVLMCCWVCVWVGVFSAAQTKLPSYVTPMYPALALLAACFVYRMVRGSPQVSPAWFTAAFGTAALVGAVFCIALPVAASMFIPGEEALGAIGAILLVGGATCIVLSRRGRTRQAAFVYAGTALAFTTLLAAVVTQRVDRHQQMHVLLETIDAHSSEPQVASFGCLEPTWVFYGRRPIRNFDGSLDDDVTAFVRADGDSFVITTEAKHLEVEDRLPSDVRVLAKVPYFLRDRTLVLLGRPNGSVRTAVAAEADETTARH